MDNRIGSKFLNASIGFGGSCFKKDILNLVYLCRHYGLEEVAVYWEGVLRINDFQKDRFIRNMVTKMFNTLSGKRICLFGFAFKANTGDTRETPALDIARKLMEEKAEVVITDPKALDNARLDLSDTEGNVIFEDDPYEAAKDCHAIAIMTEWELYKSLDYEKINERMEKPAFIFDGRNIINREKCHQIGFNVFSIGKAPLTHC